MLTHRLTLNRVNNPSTLANLFSIYSYVGKNIDNVICSGQTQVNLLNTALLSCDLDAKADHNTKLFNSIYHFGFTCPNVIRNNSIAYIKIPNNFAFNNNNNVDCWADNRDNLLTDTCAIKYINGSFFIEVPNIMINKN